ncbi:cell division protein ZapA [Selenomonas sp. TAMA-11512]|uniref:cell division protein ZapA n=1 Tax=Selenomonas sp. TAMA-11512 TaxID=3095337 RepID=UPI003088A530|nr:cell division protein ZapA [Selenomonas sp. TAMA-11512]
MSEERKAKEKKQHKVVVEVFGEIYPLKSEQPPEYVEAVARLVDDTIKGVAKTARVLGGHKIVTLAAMQIADEYMMLKKDYDELVALIEGDKKDA